jgi:hypothetical protein
MDETLKALIQRIGLAIFPGMLAALNAINESTTVLYAAPRRM